MPQLVRHSLHAKIIVALVLVLLIPTVVISAYSQWRIQQTLLDQVANEYLQLAEARANAAEGMIARSSADLLFLIQAPAMRRYARGEAGAGPDVARYFETFLGDNAGRYSGICLIDKGGREAVCVRQSAAGFAPVAGAALRSRHDQPYFIDALSRAGIPGDGRVQISGADATGSERSLVRYSTAMEDEQGDLAGVVVMEAPLAPIFDLLVDTSPRVSTYLVDHDGSYLVHNDVRGEVGHASLDERYPEDAATILRLPRGVISSSPESPDLVRVFTRVRPAGQSAIQWTLIYTQPRASILAEVREIVLFSLAITAAALIAALIAANLLARGIVRPVVALAEAAERVGAGDLHAAIPHEGSDEIAALGQTLDRTVARLREAVEVAERRRQEAETLGAATRALSSTLSPERVLELIFSELRKVVPFDSASLQVLDGDLVTVIGVYGLAKGETILGRSFSLASGASPNAEVVRSRAPFILADAPARYPLFRADPYAEDPIQSWLGVPLLFGDRLTGMITLDKHEPGFYSHEHARLALDYAAQAAIAMENARLYEAARTDLAERRRAEAANARLAAIVEATTDAVGMSDLEGNLFYMNRAFRALVGVADGEELASMQLGALMPERQRAWFLREVLPAAAAHGSWHGEELLLSRAGEEIPVSQVLIAHHAADGRPEYFSTVIRDVRELKRAEEELRQAQKMEALGRLAGGLAHDFNNLLTVILGECDLMLAELPPGDPNYISAEQIRQSGVRATALTRQLLAFSRRQVLQTEPVDLNEVISGMEQMLRRLIGEDIMLTIALAHNLPTVRADSGQMEQVVMNLAINARDAMPEGGRLLIETCAVVVDAEQHRQRPELAPGLHAMVAVSDTGVGIDQAARAHIFEPFFTTKPRGKGTGLGLATVHGIVRQSGGQIWFASEPDQGSTFEIYLPAVPELAALPEVARPQGQEQAAAETVLLVEDDEHVRRLARTILLRAGFTVLEAGDGPAALAIAKAHEGPIHALLTDVVMPGGLNGVQVASEVRNLRPAICVVYMSGYTDNALVGRSLVDDDARYIQKPFTPDGLVKALLEALAQQASGRV